MTDTHDFGFSDGVLHIASPLQKLRIRFGSEPKAEAQDTSGRWRETWPAFRLLVPESDPTSAYPFPVGSPAGNVAAAGIKRDP